MRMKQFCEKCRALNDHVRCYGYVSLQLIMGVDGGPVDTVTFNIGLALVPFRTWHRDTAANVVALRHKLSIARALDALEDGADGEEESLDEWGESEVTDGDDES